ncbi:hypothetical protein EV361DRAFT_1013403 [Lentinula raphanica]|nr:hypothetical protein EV361DRAFT_1013403 [Lentinula raphanica]
MRSHSIAIAGGTGRIGRHIVEGLLEIKQQYSFELIVLSRSNSSDISFAGTSAPVIRVDYQDVSSIQKVLNEHQVDTVISTVSATTASDAPDAFITSQETLLRAASSVPSVRRFAPSEFSVNSEQVPGVELSVRSSSLFNCGVFMNYLGYGNTKPDGHRAHGHMPHFPYVYDLSKRSADIPGDGEKQLIYTRAEDVGKFVAAATQLEAWEEYYEMAGDVLSMNEILHLCEDACGTKFDVKYNSREEIHARLGPPEKTMENFFVQFLLAIMDGDCDLNRPLNLNKAVDVKPMTVEQYLKRWWV